MTYCFTVYYLFKNCFDSTNIHTLSLVLIDNIILEFSKLAFQQTVDISLGTFYFLLKQISNFTLRWICEVLSLIYSHFSECLVESWSYGYDREKIFFLLSLFMFLKLKQFDVFYKGDDFSFLPESTYRYLMHFLILQSFINSCLS